jgi:hypothetical protein
LKSNKQKRSERLEFFRDARARGELPVNTTRLSSTGYSYSIPAFVERGTYAPIEFTCKMCGKVETWTAHQQKWWYETAKGDVLSTATRCRPCRAEERTRRDEARRAHLEGVARKLRGLKC